MKTRSALAPMQGFTIVEILVALAIVALLASFALPAYRDSTLRAGRADGKAALMQVASDQERFYSNNFSYSTNAVPLAATPAATLTSRDGNYVISVAACAGGAIANCFVASAAPQGSQVADTCGTLTINQLGVRAASGGSVEDCWER
jgi:type IV pilus assembly protein PilE